MKKIAILPKTIIITTIILFAVLVGCRVNMSNIGSYKAYLKNNIEQTQSVIIGVPRSIRSDEWLVTSSTVYYNAQHDDNSKLEKILNLANIPLLGFLFLPNDMAYSFMTLVMYVLLFLSGIYFFNIFTKGNWLLNILFALIIVFQPGIAWWNSSGTYAIFFASVDLFYYYFQIKNIWNKIAIAIGLIFCIGYYVINAYPAWMVPLGYYSAILLAAMMVRSRKEKKQPISKIDIIIIAATVMAMIGFCVLYLYARHEYITAVLSTVYPGKRSDCGGGVSAGYLAFYLLQIKLPFKEITFLNESEASTFLSLFPLPWIVFAIWYKKLKDNKAILLSLLFSLVCYVYATIGFPTWLAKITLWELTTSYRIYIIGDFAMLVALLLEVIELSRDKEDKIIVATKGKNIVGGIILIAFFAFSIAQDDIRNYLGRWIIVSCGIVFLSYLLLCMKKQWLFIVLLLSCSIVSGAVVNSLNVGTQILDQTKLAEKIKEINDEDKGNWITLNDNVISKYVKTQGVDCINALSYPPRLDLFKPLDQNGENEEVYNRYAHVIVHLTNSKNEFNLLQSDLFEININYRTLKKWKIKYIISTENISVDTEDIRITKIYDDLDNYDIYKVEKNLNEGKRGEL